MLRFLPMIAVAVATATPASSAGLPANPQVVTPISDDQFARDIQSVIAVNDPSVALPKLEAMTRRRDLSEQQSMTVAVIRISSLQILGRGTEAMSIGEEMIVGRPQSADAQLVMATAAFAASNYERSAQAIRRASELEPDVVNRIQVYELSIIISWLKSQDKLGEATALAQRLFDAGWDNGGPRFRSMLALDVIEEHLSDNDPTGAGRYVPMIADPGTFAKIFSERRFAGVKAAALDWAGSRIEKQWPVYLERVHGKWSQFGGPEQASDYAAALSLAGHDKTLVDTFLPIFDRTLNPDEDVLWVFVVAPVARSLASLGRWNEAFALFDRASKIWPPSYGANAINIDANRARYRMLKGDFTTAVRLYDALLDQVKAAEKEVTPQTRAYIDAYRLCSIHRARQGDVTVAANALSAQWTMREPNIISWLQLCIGKRGDALKTWQAALANPQARTDAVAYIQDLSDIGPKSVFVTEMRAAIIDLKDDPQLRAAVQPYGERLGWTLQEAAPREVVAQSR